MNNFLEKSINERIEHWYNRNYNSTNINLQPVLSSLKAYHKNLNSLIFNPNPHIVELIVKTVWEYDKKLEKQSIILENNENNIENKDILLVAKNKHFDDISMNCHFDGSKLYNVQLKFSDCRSEIINEILKNKIFEKKFKKKILFTVSSENKRKILLINLNKEYIKDFLELFFEIFTNYILKNELVI